MMKTELAKSEAPEIVEQIYEILSNFFFDLESHWAIKQYILSLDDNSPSRPLWILFSNNCLQMAVIEWCKIFGSKYNNATHYTHCIDELDGIEETVNNMREFRDKYISHFDFYDKPIPFMQRAVEVIERFDYVMLKKYITEDRESTATFIMNCRKDIHKRLLSILSGQ